MTTMTTPSGEALSPFAFGTMQFGKGSDAATSAAVYAAARSAGINHFDTAWVYNEGRSEEILGALVKPDRERLFIATKVGAKGGGGRDNILKQLDDSRRRLDMDSVDLLYMHRFDTATPLQETFETLADVQSRGLTRHIAISNYTAWQLMKAQWVASGFGTRIDALQPMYSLIKRQVEVELLPAAADQDISVFSYSPLGGGVLTGKYAADPGDGRLTWDTAYQKRYAADWIGDSVAGLLEIAAELGTSPATLAVAWAARHPGIAAPIVSARTVEQLQPSLAALEFAMDDALYARLSALVPTPPPATDRTEEA